MIFISSVMQLIAPGTQEYSSVSAINTGKIVDHEIHNNNSFLVGRSVSLLMWVPL